MAVSFAIDQLATPPGGTRPTWSLDVVMALLATEDSHQGGRLEVSSDAEELAAYNAAKRASVILDGLVQSVDGHTLDLTDIRRAARQLVDDLEAASHAASRIRQGLRPPADTEPGPPTPGQVEVWHEHRQLVEFAEISVERDRAATARSPHVQPTHWRITKAAGNGVFRSAGAGGEEVHGWAEVPEAVPDLLRAWSTPAGAPVIVTWADTPVKPRRRLPIWGWLPDHPGNLPEGDADADDLRGLPNPHEAWRRQPSSGLDAFAGAVEDLRTSWSPTADLGARLEAAAVRLNSEEPQAPDLHRHLDTVEDLGATRTAMWLDPAAIAHSGTDVWNGFGDHRPEQIENFARGLLTCDDPADFAEQVWACPYEPVSLYRVPGPAGPLFEIGVNGMHRIHTARLLGFPLIWAVVTQHSLPLTVSWWTFRDPDSPDRGDLAEDMAVTWRGLLRHGLLDGDLDEDTVVLRPTWVAASWLLAPPASAMRWARNYERVYSGALSGLGVPGEALDGAEAWLSWLAA